MSWSKLRIFILLILTYGVTLIKSQRRIFGGKNIEITKATYMVSINEQYDAFRYMHVCGGSYIHPDWVLTAGHCLVVVDQAKPLETQKNNVGYQDRFMLIMGSAQLYDEKAQRIRSKELVLHPEYHIPTQNYDIGLIKIAEPFKKGPFVSIVKLAEMNYESDDLDATLFGWGSTARKESQLSQTLLMTVMPVINKTACRRQYLLPSYAIHFKDNRVICASYSKGGRSVCNGDSGGPMIMDDAQVGIISWTLDCGSTKPAVCTNVFYHRSFIQRYTKLNFIHATKAKRRSHSITTTSNTVSILLCNVLVTVLMLTISI